MDYRGSNHASVVGLAVTAFVANNVEEDFSNMSLQSLQRIHIYKITANLISFVSNMRRIQAQENEVS